MGLEQNLPLTKSFLWQELLLRRITNLQLDKENLVEQIEQLEERLTQTPSRDLSTDAFLMLLTRAIGAIRLLPQQVQTEVVFTEKLIVQAQKKILTKVEGIYQDSLRLELMISESSEGIRAILEQIQTSTTLFMQDSYLYQEKMTADLNNLYDEQGNLQTSFSEASKVIKNVQHLAQAKQKQLKKDAFQQREILSKEIEIVKEQNQQLQMALHSAIQAAKAICYWLDDV